jgi:hypothetical protein
LRIFAVNGGRGKQEHARYSTELSIWYQTQVSIIDGGLSRCLRSIGAENDALNMFSGVFEPILSATGGLPGMTQMIEPLKESLKFDRVCALRLEIAHLN